MLEGLTVLVVEDEPDARELLQRFRVQLAAAVTALSPTDARRRALMAGYESHIAKPIDAGELVAVVATLAGRTGRARNTRG